MEPVVEQSSSVAEAQHLEDKENSEENRSHFIKNGLYSNIVKIVSVQTFV